MSSINWPEVIAIFVGFGAFFIYLMNHLDNFKKELSDKIDVSIEKSKKELKAEIRDLDKKIEGLQKDINRIDSNVSNIEGQITQMTRPKFIPVDRPPDQGIKEN